MRGFDWKSAYGHFINCKDLLLRKNGAIASLSIDDGLETYTLLADSLNSSFFLEGDEKISAKAVYLAFKRHLPNIFPDFLANAPIAESSTSDSEEEDVPTRTVTVDIDEDILTPTLSTHTQRIKLRLAHGWSTKLSKIVAKAVEAKECVFTFKSHEFVRGELSTTACCNECGAVAKILGNSGAKQIDLKFYAGLSGVHNKKRRIFGDERRTLASKAKFQTSVNVRNEIIEDEYAPEDVLNPNMLPTLKKISQMRHEDLKREYLHPDLFEALDIFNASNDTRFRNSLKIISRKPFVVAFWLPIQKELYKMLSKSGRKILSIDATGSIVRAPLKDTDGTYPTIYVYNIVIWKEGFGSIPVGHFISSEHSAFQISYCLGKWATDFAAPEEVVVDFSLALISAVVERFTEFKTRSEYINACFRFCKGESNNLPATFIRIDVAHFVAILHRNKHFKKLDPRSRKFYLNIFGVLINTQDYNVAVYIVTCMMSLASSPFIAENSEIIKMKDFLIKSIKTHDVEQHFEALKFESKSDPAANDQVCFDDDIKSGSVFESIFDNVLIDETGDDNLYFAPDCRNEMKRILSSLPMWSGIMVKAFGSSNLNASSAFVENSFKEMKHNIFQGKTNLRADYFVQKYCNSLSSSLRYWKASKTNSSHEICETPSLDINNAVNSNQDSNEIFSCTSPNKSSEMNEMHKRSGSPLTQYLSDMSSLENWKGKAEKEAKRRRRSAYSILEPQNFYEGHKTPAALPFLSNGAKTNHGQRVIITTNTCAFDSLIQTFVALLIDSDIEIHDELDLTITELLTDIAQKGFKMFAKKKRNEILKDLFNYEIQEHNFLMQISCETNVCYLAQKIKIKPSISVQYKCHEEKTTDLKYLPINIDVFDDDNNLNCLSNFIDISDKVCDTCDSLVVPSVSTGKIIFIDCQKKDPFAKYSHITTEHIQSQINTCGSSFSLQSIIHFIPPSRNNGVGHYIALIRRPNLKWEAYDDLLKKCGKIPTFINPALLIYIQDSP